LIARGGLLILAVGLSAGAVADLLATGGDKYVSSKMGVGGLCLANLFLAAIFYSFVSEVYTKALQDGTALEDLMDIYSVSLISVFSYGAAVVTGGACVVIAVLAERSTVDETATRTE
jgi:hypothetical protein